MILAGAGTWECRLSSKGILHEAARLLCAAQTLWRGSAQEGFARLGREYDAIKRKRRECAPHHNLIQFLGYERKEVGFHSPFLCDLLDPNGTHDQGTLF